MKQPLLFLCHRIPFPPNKGDKIRSYHLLRYLVEHYEVYLGALIDDPADWAYTATLEKLCSGCFFVGLNQNSARAKSLAALFSGAPLTLSYYSNRRMHQWVKTVVEEKSIKRAMLFSSAMAQYVMDEGMGLETRVMDFVDIDSDKWRQYAGKKGWPMNWLYGREADALFGYEQMVAASFDASLFVSSAEAAMFKRLTRGLEGKIGYYNNGVDTDYFRTIGDLENPYPPDVKALVFTGAMDYWPNVDAVTWFAQDIFPQVRKAESSAVFYIVGSNPTRAVQELARIPGVFVTGRVEDVRPYIRFAALAVAPMRVARGIQNKVLEAMAMERAVVVSRQGLEGIEAVPGKEVLLAENAEGFVSASLKGLAGQYADMGAAARERVVNDFNWQGNLAAVGRVLDGSASTPVGA